MKSNSLIAVLPKQPVSNGRRLDKVLATGYKLIAHNGTEFKELVTAFIWKGKSNTSSQVHAAIWVPGDDSNNRPWLSGSGKASGWGHHKASAALSEAIDSAGIKLYGTPYSRGEVDYTKPAQIEGVGNSAMELAIYAIGQACGYSLEQLHLVTIQ